MKLEFCTMDAVWAALLLVSAMAFTHRHSWFRNKIRTRE